jgi:hypothetical protein
MISWIFSSMNAEESEEVSQWNPDKRNWPDEMGLAISK